MSDRLLAIAAAHHGVVSSRDAGCADVEPNAVAALVRAHTLVHVRRAAYVLGTAWDAASPEGRLALRTRAVLHARGNGAATHQSALAVHGLPLHGVPLDVVDITGAVRRVRRLSNLRVHPADPGVPSQVVDGCAVVPVEIALAQVAMRHGREALVVPADAALHRRATDLESLGEALLLQAPTPRAATRAARWVHQTDALSESVGESRTRLLLTDLGHGVRSQVRVVDGSGIVVARVDLLVGERVVVEFDGLVKYEGAAGRRALAAEKRREDRLRELGYEVVRLTWADLARPQRVATLIHQALQRSRPR